jgi:hypothetical protein
MHMNKENKYDYTVKRQLSQDELNEYHEAYWPKLELLNSRYSPQSDITLSVLDKLEYLDFLRTKWLFDDSPDRPSFDFILHGLGFAFGLLFHRKLGMQWCLIEDRYGEAISLIYSAIDKTKNNGHISFPPFSYVKKRKDVMDGVIFFNGFNRLAKMISDNGS